MKTTLLLCGALFCAASFAHGDEALRSVQQQLKDEGFFFGTVDGAAGKETNDAIRRYQIRNGLDVSGKLDDATQKALQQQEGGGASNARGNDSAPADAPPVVSRPTAQPRLQPPPKRSLPAPTPENEEDRPYPGRQSVPPPRAGDVPDSSAGSYARFFRRTPYEIAPPVVQHDTVRRAKSRLAEAGYLRGPVNDLPTPDLADALRAYQARRNLKTSGRLDMDTLERLHLMPSTERAPRERPEPRAYRGVWLD